MSKTILWQSKDAVAGISAHYDGDAALVAGNGLSETFSGVSIDSRTIAQDELFIAIKGDQFDGHDFVSKALGAGAGAALVQSDFALENGNEKLIKVADPLEGMNALGQAARARLKGKMIGITGSVGKTGSKEMLRLCLADQGKVHASEKSFNNHWGVPLSLSLMPDDTDFGVAEIGMNHPGEITPLTGMVRPDVALVTTVQAAHLGHFSSLEEIAEAKAEIFSGLEIGGTAILNRDNEWFDLLAARANEQGARILTFGEDSSADFRLVSFQPTENGSHIVMSYQGQEIVFDIGMPGRHIAMNALGVLGVVHACGGDVASAAKALTHLQAPTGRGERFGLTIEKNKEILLIDESYNANPASMRAAIKTLEQTDLPEGGRKIVVLGDMLELGGQSEQLHADLKAPLSTAGVEVVFAVGEQMKALFDALPEKMRGNWVANAAEVEAFLTDTLQSGDAVMVKGSLGSKVGSVVSALKKRAEAHVRDI